MEKKYILTDRTKEVDGHILHRIQAIKDFSNVHNGDLGGWIESEDNLSQEGGCWVRDEAMVYENATIQYSAQVYDLTMLKYMVMLIYAVMLEYMVTLRYLEMLWYLDRLEFKIELKYAIRLEYVMLL